MTSKDEKELLSACKKGSSKLVHKLLSQTPSIDVNCKTEKGKTPLFLASWKGHADIVQNLLTVKDTDATIRDNVGLQPMHTAAEFGHIRVISALLAHGVDINVQDSINGQTPLYSACSVGQLQTIKWLIGNGADPNIQRLEGLSLLHTASKNNHSSVVTYLLQQGLNVNCQATNGFTPLHAAAYYGNDALIPLLLKAGADPNLADQDGYTPLCMAAQEGHAKSLSLLLPVSDINKQAKNGCSALRSAAAGGHVECTTLLLKAGAETKLLDIWGYDALGRAAEVGFDKCVLLLLKHGAEVRWDHEKSPLKLAQEKGHTLVIEILEDYEKNPEKYKHRAVTPPALNKLTLPAPTKPTVESRGTATCPLKIVATKFIQAMNLSAGYFDHDYDVCFCGSCHTYRGDNLYYTRGYPPKDYGLPIGWYKFGLKVPARANVIGALKNWHVAFHGTKAPNIENILITGELLMTGDVTPAGYELRPPPGHFDTAIPGMEPPKDFDISKIYLSPSIRYSGCDVYAPICTWKPEDGVSKHHLRVAFQVRIKPGTYEVGPETIGAGRKRIDPRFSNRELEWSTKRRGVTVLVGLLVKVEGMGDEPDLDWSTQVAAATPALPQPGMPSKADVRKTSSTVGKHVKVLYPITHSLAKGTDIKLDEMDTVVIEKEVDETHFMVYAPGPFRSIKFPVSRNMLDL